MIRAITHPWVLRLLLVAVIAAAWLYANGPGDVSPLLLPPVGTVAEEFAELVTSGSTWSNFAITVLEMVLAFTLGASAAVLFGAWASRTPLRARTWDTLLAWAYIAPSAVFYPLFILWFGIGIWSKVVYAAIVGFSPIAFNTLRGLVSVDPRLIQVGHAFGASRRQTEWIVKLGAARPMVLSGVRIGAALVVINVILGEMLAAREGLGFMLAERSQTIRVPETFAVIALIMLLVAIVHPFIERGVRAGDRR